MGRFGIAFAGMAVFAVSCFISCGSPESDGKEAAKRIRECDELYTERLTRRFDEFVKNFDDYKFETRIEARKCVEKIIDEETKVYESEIKKAEYEYLEYKEKYKRDCDDAQRFELAYQKEKDLGGHDVQHGLPSQLCINDKILTIIPPKPDDHKIKHDLDGRTFKDKADGYFADEMKRIKTDAIKGIVVLSEIEENGLYRLNADILLEERAGSAAFDVNLDIIYVLGNADDWFISGISANSVNIVKTGQFDKYITTSLNMSLFGRPNGIYINNSSDMTLIVGGVFLDGKSWRKFSVDVNGNGREHIYCTDYDIHFIERR